jgi:general secretion pathway protein I
MRSASIGTRAGLPSLLRKRDGNRAGFTLLEALVAFALITAFVAALGPHLFHARRLMSAADGRISAQLLLRSLLTAPFDRSALARSREGEAGGLRWRISAEPILLGALPSPRPRTSPAQQPEASDAQHPSWTAFRVVATVSWGAGLSVSADTIRLANTEPQ